MRINNNNNNNNKYFFTYIFLYSQICTLFENIWKNLSKVNAGY